MSKAKLRNFYIDIYSITVFYSISSFKTFKKLLKEEFNYELPSNEREGNCTGFTIPLEHKSGADGIFIWIDNKYFKKEKVKVHEAFHAATMILNSRDITLGECTSSKETFAYLIAHIFDKLK